MVGPQAAFLERCAQRWPDKAARLSDGFYRIKDKAGRVVPFRMNHDQRRFLNERHGMDVILKARQKGFTTIIQLDMLDDCLFRPNTGSGIVAHNREDAEAFFADKIKFAYDELPPEFRSIVRAEQDSAKSLKFSNGSSIRVGTSLRSGTFQRLHVSEYGKLCAKFPDKAKEVKTGAFNTVQAGQRITVESTAEGQAGHYFEMTQAAKQRAEAGTPLTALDFKFHFYPWWTSDEYSLDEDVTEPADLMAYFDKLEHEHGIELTKGQRAWYVKKAEQQGDDVMREYPSTPDEAFEASIEGAYFKNEMAKLRRERRICRIPIMEAPVYTTWDLGLNDSMAITFWQDHGFERRAIDYYENSGEGFAHYARVLIDKGYAYSRHYMPHDAEQRALTEVAEPRRVHAERAGITPIEVLKRIETEQAGIDASRAFLASVWIDESRCARLVRCLDNYRKAWDDKLGVFKTYPVHDEYSHGYKSFESAAIRPVPAKAQVIDYSKRGVKGIA
jgi:hypothetical protein